MQLRKFIANLVCVFIPTRKIRHSVRYSLSGQKKRDAAKKELEKQAYLKLKQEWLKHTGGQKLLPARFEKYDLVFGIGSICHVRMYLDIFKLARFTTPLDWTAPLPPQNFSQSFDLYRDTKFKEKIDFVCNNFAGYYEPKDMRLLSDGFNPKQLHHNVANIKTGIFMPHIFPIDISVEQFLPQFCDIMARRAKRLTNAIENSDKILIVWMHRVFDNRDVADKTVPDQDIKNAVEKLNKRFPGKKFDLVFFEHDGYKDKFEYEKQEVAPGAYRILSNHWCTASEYGYKYTFLNLPFYTPSLCVAEALDNISLTGKKIVD